MSKRISITILTAMNRAVDAIRNETMDTIPAQHIAAFVWIATNEGASVSSLSDYMGLSQAAASRAVSAMGKWKAANPGRKRTPGYDLVSSQEDPMERRRKLLYLTPKGKQLASSICDIFSRA